MTTTDGQDKQVLFFGAKDTASGETTGTYYTVGHLDGNGLFIADTGTKRLDQGSDYYGANFTGSNRIEESNHNLISLGWLVIGTTSRQAFTVTKRPRVIF